MAAAIDSPAWCEAKSLSIASFTWWGARLARRAQLLVIGLYRTLTVPRALDRRKRALGPSICCVGAKAWDLVIAAGKTLTVARLACSWADLAGRSGFGNLAFHAGHLPRIARSGPIPLLAGGITWRVCHADYTTRLMPWGCPSGPGGLFVAALCAMAGGATSWPPVGGLFALFRMFCVGTPDTTCCRQPLVIGLALAGVPTPKALLASYLVRCVGGSEAHSRCSKPPPGPYTEPWSPNMNVSLCESLNAPNAEYLIDAAAPPGSKQKPLSDHFLFRAIGRLILQAP